MFTPTQIIYSLTSSCNLHCAHCAVDRARGKLDAQKAISFLKRVKNSFLGESVTQVGFTGGETFLALDALCAISQAAFDEGFTFGRVMTNGVWWGSVEELRGALKRLFDAHFDGTLCVSYDAFHAQSFERVWTFFSVAHEVFGTSASYAVQSVKKGEEEDFCEELARLRSCAQKCGFDILCDRTELSLPPKSAQAWSDDKWFLDEDCFSMGNIFFVHPDGRLAPCCGFANEGEALCIGEIGEDIEKIMARAKGNSFLRLCFEKGLSSAIKAFESKLKKEGKFENSKAGECKGGKSVLQPFIELESAERGARERASGKTRDPCVFCAALQSRFIT